VPPIEGFDFTPWIEEMGADALPFGLNVFPIEQLGIEVDRMLAINEDNCDRFKEEFTVPELTLTSLIKLFQLEALCRTSVNI
jgi:hypothetical protein